MARIIASLTELELITLLFSILPVHASHFQGWFLKLGTLNLNFWETT